MFRRHNCVTELLRRGANVNLADRGGFTPLMDAAWNGEMNMVIVLLKHGADPRALGHSHFSGGIKTTERTAAEWARIRGKEEVAEHIENWMATPESVLQGVRVRPVGWRR